MLTMFVNNFRSCGNGCRAPFLIAQHKYPVVLSGNIVTFRGLMQSNFSSFRTTLHNSFYSWYVTAHNTYSSGALYRNVTSYLPCLNFEAKCSFNIIHLLPAPCACHAFNKLFKCYIRLSNNAVLPIQDMKPLPSSLLSLSYMLIPGALGVVNDSSF